MKIGIVGNEEAKFTRIGEARARELILSLLQEDATEVVSGGCHLGGIDEWAAQIGYALKLKVTEHLPQKKSWEYYKVRNIKIAEDSDEIHCIVVDKLPKNYRGMRFPLCYHCKATNHVKSGGCWTMNYAIGLGKIGMLHIIENF